MHGPQKLAGIGVCGLLVAAGWAMSLNNRGNHVLAQAPGDKPSENPPAKVERDKDLSHFMRVKLEASGKILEGLAIEDFSLIVQGARQLNAMSKAEKWRVSNDPIYRQFSGDFQRVTQELVEAAQGDNLDRAALKWMDATMGCIECHRYARGMMIAGEYHESPAGN